jgi:protein SCO1
MNIARLLWVFALAATVVAAHAHQKKVTFSSSSIEVPAVEVTDQYGSVSRLDELISGRRIVLTFQFVDCKTLCPAADVVMAGLDQLITKQNSSDVLLISVTLAPGDDTPERLLKKASDLGASPQWAWLTGSEANIASIGRTFGLNAGEKEQHDVFFVVGVPSKGKFKRVAGLPTPQQLFDSLEDLSN